MGVVWSLRCSRAPGRGFHPGRGRASWVPLRSSFGRPTPELQALVVRRPADRLEVQAVRRLDRQLREQDAPAVRLHRQDVAFDRVDPLDLLLALPAAEAPRELAVFRQVQGVLRRAFAGGGPVAEDLIRRDRFGGRPSRRLSWLGVAGGKGRDQRGGDRVVRLQLCRPAEFAQGVLRVAAREVVVPEEEVEVRSLRVLVAGRFQARRCAV